MAENELGDRQALESKRKIPCIAQERHLEKPESMNQGNGIFPMREALIVPQFPEKPAHQGRQGRQPQSCPVTARDSRKYRLLSRDDLQRRDQQQGRHPHEREKNSRPNSNPNQPRASQNENEPAEGFFPYRGNGRKPVPPCPDPWK